MSKLYQVRYTVGDKTVAHEHYTEKGGKLDAKALSKVIGNAMMGEIEIKEDSSQALVRVWEFTGGEIGKPINKDPAAPPSHVEVLKTADETRLPEGTKEKKPKAPKLSDEEKIAKERAEAEEKIKAIDSGTYVVKARGRKSSTPKEPKQKVETNKVAKLMETLGTSEKTATILNEIGVTTVSRRAKVAVMVIDHSGPILASEIIENLQKDPKETGEVTLKKVVSTVNIINYLLSREEQPWRIVPRDHGEDNKLFNFVPVRIEYQDTDLEQDVA
jgi:hypothetical protein